MLWHLNTSHRLFVYEVHPKIKKNLSACSNAFIRQINIVGITTCGHSIMPNAKILMSDGQIPPTIYHMKYFEGQTYIALLLDL